MKPPLISCCLSLLLLASPPVDAAFKAKDDKRELPVYTQKGFIRLDNQTVAMPNGEKDMGLVGAHYLLELSPYLNLGGGFLGAVYGNQGGMFTLGATANSKLPITDNLYGEAGVYFGGGGGQRSLVGGGMVLNYHAGLGFNLNSLASLEVAYADLNFIDGAIHSSQLMLILDVPFDYRYSNYQLHNLTRPFKDLNFINTLPYPSTAYLAMLGFVGEPVNNTVTLDNQAINSTLGYLGAEFGNYLDSQWFAYGQAAAMVDGLRAGYMQVLGGLGLDYALSQHFHLLPKAGLGAGGGGGTDTGGGFLLNSELALEYQLNNHYALDLVAGYLYAPDGNYQVVTGGIAAKYLPKAFYHNKAEQPETFQGWRLNVGHQSYTSAKRLGQREHLGLLQGQLDFIINQNLYLAGQGDFAYIGNSGAYGEGLFGLGLQKPIDQDAHLELFAEVLAGTSGGGGIDTQDGFIVKPTIGVFKAINEQLALRASVGEMYSVESKWSTLSLQLGISYKLSTVSEA